MNLKISVIFSSLDFFIWFFFSFFIYSLSRLSTFPFTSRSFVFISLSMIIICAFRSVQLLSHVLLFEIPWTIARQGSLSITNSWSLLKLMSVESVMPSNCLILFCPLLLPSIFPSIRAFSSESVLHIRWPKYWSFSFNITSSNEYSGLISVRIDWFDLLAIHFGSVQFSRSVVSDSL